MNEQICNHCAGTGEIRAGIYRDAVFISTKLDNCQLCYGTGFAPVYCNMLELNSNAALEQAAKAMEKRSVKKE